MSTTVITVASRLGNIEQYKYNPAKMQRAALETLRTLTDGEIDVVDATNPFVFCMETTAVNTAAFMQHAEALHRRQYPVAATTAEDLYLHMSDKDYIGRFALPARALFTLMFSKTELLAALVLDPLTGIRKITIPRNTVFTVADTAFSLQYPVDVRELAHGGLQAVYDNSTSSPLQTLSTNMVELSEVYDPNGMCYLKLSLEAHQFTIATKYNDVNAASGFKTTIALTDAFYHVRVYTQQADMSWTEIQTTHTQQIYDPATPTAIIKVLESRVQVVVPVIYTSTGQVRNKLRVDVYETKGALSMLLGNYKLEDFSVMWKTIDAADANVYVAPLRAIKTMAVYSESAIASGRPALTLEELRQRVIANSVGAQLLPITNVQLQSSLADSGYEIVKNVDTVTNRIFLATKPMPKPVDERLITAAASSVATVLLSFNEAQSAYGVNIHAQSITLTPSTLYENINGVTRLVRKSAYAALMAVSSAQLCLEVNARNYLYSPFHYVLDASEGSFDVRPYYLDTPQILSKSFEKENAASGLQVSVDSTYVIVRTSAGYRLTLSTRSNPDFKALTDSQVFAQLRFQAQGAPNPAYLLGVQRARAVTDERVYDFDMATTFDLDAAHTLDQSSFTSSPALPAPRSDLLQAMSVLFCTTAPLASALLPTEIDEALGRFQLPTGAVGLTNETLSIRFGFALTTLWAQGRSVVASVPYATYVTDVPRLYTQDVYALDALDGSAFTVDADGTLKWNVLHAKNDPVLDAAGKATYAHRSGDPMLDAEGNPVPKAGYLGEMVRHVDITAIEGAYRFATDSVATEYCKLIDASLLNWLTEDLARLNANLLDQTKIYFYPKVNQGSVRVMTGSGLESKIPAGQSFAVTLHVPASTYSNALLLTAIKKTTVRTIDAAIKGLTTAVSAIEQALRVQYGADVIDVQLTGLGGAENIPTLTVLDVSNRLSIRKRLITLPDEQLIVEEDIDIVFIRHALPS